MKEVDDDIVSFDKDLVVLKEEMFEFWAAVIAVNLMPYLGFCYLFFSEINATWKTYVFFFIFSSLKKLAIREMVDYMHITVKFELCIEDYNLKGTVCKS